MHLVVISHKVCWRSSDSPSGYATDGGFPVQMLAISQLFSKTTLVLPCESGIDRDGGTALTGRGLTVLPMTVPLGRGFARKLGMLNWLRVNISVIWKEAKKADAVHAPIPGDVGTIGILAAVLLKKRLFVRHCGNWLMPRTIAERIWKRGMEYLAGPGKVMLATGGTAGPPSPRNPAVRWIFSTSLRRDQMIDARPRRLPSDGGIKLIIACRQETGKGTEVVIESMRSIVKHFPKATLHVVGGGSLLDKLKLQSSESGDGGRIVFHGKIGQPEVLGLLREAHLFCYPTSASEGFPKVVLEAMASGLPVIATRVSVLPQLLGDGSGILLDKPCPMAVAAAVKDVCGDNAKYQNMSSKAIDGARNYTLENWGESIRTALCDGWGTESLIQGVCEPQPVRQL